MDEQRTIKEIMKVYDDGYPVYSIEMGGLGPSYEQVIQVSAFEIIKDLKFKCPNKKQAEKVLDRSLMKIDKKMDMGHSGATAGAAKWLAYKFMNTGYAETINTAPKNRLIQIDNRWGKLRTR